MKALVTGAAGFVGSRLTAALVARGDDVRALVRTAAPEPRLMGAEVVTGDIRDGAATARACQGRDVVFHVAAKAGGWGRRRDFEEINVGGTRHVIAGCQEAGVKVLVFTSSPSVVHADADLEGGTEALPHATRFLADYPRTKALAERAVLDAAHEGLATIALRPHLVWGPGDRHLLPRLVARARAGRLRQVGRRDPLTDTTYIDNCVAAHLLAADALRENPSLSGRAYFISDDQPLGLWTMANRLLAAAGAPPVGRPIPAGLAFALATVLEAAHAVLRLSREPLLTRFAVSQLCHAQWYDISAAKRDLGYAPTVTIDEGLRRLAASFAE